MLFFKQQPKFTLIVQIIVLGLISLSAYAYTPVEIVKSPSDQRQYRGMLLDNGLKVLLVSDAKAEKAAAALNVAVGSFNEPHEREGLAHFLEHMLFLGTKKYPQASEYNEYIAAHGGSNNAWTGDRNTQYYFDITPDHLPGALDRFAQFFIAPMFNQELVDRERHAVDSEYKLNIKNDGWRIHEVEKITANPDHPIVHFSMGNIQTLGDHANKKPIRESLIQFYNDYYSADRMTLSVVGPQPLDELEWLIKEYFNAIPKNVVKTNQVDTLVYTANETGQRISIKTIGDYQEISLNFPIPSQRADYESLSISYILNQFRQSGHKSLYQSLKKKNWITGINVLAGEVTHNQDLVTINYTLTNDGQQHLDDIAQYTFAFAQYLRDSGAQQVFADDLKNAGERNFQYADTIDPANYAPLLSVAMHNYPLKDVLWAGGYNKNTKFDPEKIANLLTYFTPQNMRMIVANKNISGDLLEPKYDVKYAVQKFDQEYTIKLIQSPEDATFALPEANIFMPKNFTLRAASQNQTSYSAPQQIYKMPGASLWYKQDKIFNLPKQNILFLLAAPEMKSSPKNAVMARLMQYSINDRMSELATQLSMAGVDVGVAGTTQGLVISVAMFSDQAINVMSAVVRYIQDCMLDEQRFISYKQDLARDFKNFKQQPPFRQANVILSAITIKPSWLSQDLLLALESVTKQDVEQYTKNFLTQLQIEGLIHGNITSDDAVALVKAVSAQLHVEPKSNYNFMCSRIMKLADGSKFYYTFNPEHNDAALASYYQAQKVDDKTFATNSLLVELISQPLYSQLRTKEQLGYVVGVDVLRVRQQTGILFYIESSSKPVNHLHKRINSFISDFTLNLDKMPSLEFDNYRTALRANLLREPTSLAEETARYWAQIVSGSYRFKFNLDIAQQLVEINLMDVSAYAKTLLINPKTQRNLTVAAFTTKQTFNNGKKINNIREFKSKAKFAEQ